MKASPDLLRLMIWQNNEFVRRLSHYRRDADTPSGKADIALLDAINEETKRMHAALAERER